MDFGSFHLQDLALAVSSGSANPSLEIAQGVTVYNLLLDGSNNMSGGLHGSYWNDSGSTAQSDNVVLRNLKCEQVAGSAASAVGRSVLIAPAVALRNLLLDNVMCATGPSDPAGYRNRGIYLKNVEHAVLQSCLFLSMGTSSQNEGSLIEVAAGGATQDVEWRACTFFQYAQVSMGSLELTSSGPRHGSTFLPSSAHYMVAFALKNTWRERDAFVNRITGEVSAASSTTIGIVGFEGGTAGTVTIVAYDASGASTTNYSGLASFVRSGTNCTLARLGGTNFDVTGTPSLLLSWANPDFRITNYSGIALRFFVTFEFRA